MTIRVATLEGKDLAQGIEAAARLRIEVFRAWLAKPDRRRY